jgi:hypothetical protein
MKPIIQDAPGHIVRRAGNQWEVRWQARTDLINKGFEPKSQRVWIGSAPTDVERHQISDLCKRLQDEMLIFGRGGLPTSSIQYVFDGSLRSLINLYQTDPDSRYHKKQYAVRANHNTLYRRLMDEHGDVQLADIKARLIIAWNAQWTDGGVKLATGDSFRGRLRELVTFGATILEDPECERLCGVMPKMRFENAKPRTAIMRAEQAIAHRNMARKVGWRSMALADAMQFDLTLRQKDVVGELVPMREPGVSDVHFDGKKWIKGARWEEVDENFIFRHVTSKRGKPVEADLHYAPMVMEELSLIAKVPVAELRRDMFPASGPMIISETQQRPWRAQSFRRQWRKIARLAGIPDDLRSMDARAGAITEATDAGASLEDVRHAATHSDISMTQRYSRGSAEKVATVMKLRVEHRTKTKPERD